jgi:hypothetical protein
MGIRRGSLCRSLLVCGQHSCARTRAGRTRAVRAVCAPPQPAYVGIRQHTSAYVSIRQHPCARTRACPCCGGGMCASATCIRPQTSAYVSIRLRNLHTSAYVRIRQHLPPQHPTRAVPDATCIRQHSIRQHTSAYVSIRQHLPREHSTRAVPVSS